MIINNTVNADWQTIMTYDKRSTTYKSDISSKGESTKKTVLTYHRKTNLCTRETNIHGKAVILKGESWLLHGKREIIVKRDNQFFRQHERVYHFSFHLQRTLQKPFKSNQSVFCIAMCLNPIQISVCAKGLTCLYCVTLMPTSLV